VASYKERQIKHYGRAGVIKGIIQSSLSFSLSVCVRARALCGDQEETVSHLVLVLLGISHLAALQIQFGHTWKSC